MKLERIALIMVFVVGMVIGFNGVTWSSAKSEKHHKAVQKARGDAIRRGYRLVASFAPRKAGKSYIKIGNVNYTYVKMSDEERMNAMRSLEATEKWRAKKDEEVEKFLAEEKRGKRKASQGKPYAYNSASLNERQDDKENGQGTMVFPNGDKYVGEWKDDKRDGQGVCTGADGTRYEGQWKGDQRHGFGRYAWADGRRYVGEWENNMQYGQGTYTYPDGAKYVGGWKYDMAHGFGTFVWADGSKYVGEWKGDERDGQGTFTGANGIKYEGKWMGNKFVE